MLSALPLSAARVFDTSAFISPSIASNTQFASATNAFANDTAVATRSNTNTTQRYKGYSFSIPDNVTIDGIEVRVDTWESAGSCSTSLNIALSWNNEISYTTSINTGTLGTTGDPEGTLIVGGPANLWGRAWTPSEINTNFGLKVQTSGLASGCAIALDWIPVKIYYTSSNTATPTETFVIPTATDTATSTPTNTTTNTPTPTPTFTNSPAPKLLYINEFLPHPTSDWNGDGTANSKDEWIEIFNANNFAVDLSHWQLADASSTYVIPNGHIIAPRGFSVFYRAQTDIALNDNGDDVRLLHADGALADSISYSNTHPDQSYARYPDGATYFSNLCVPSPGALNCTILPTPTFTPTPYASSVVINEFLPQPHTDWNQDGIKDSYDEWIELVNNSSQTIDLSHWQLADATSNSSFQIPDNTSIAPHAFLVFYASQTIIGLNNNGDTVRLLHPDNTVADEKRYTTSAPDRAYGRRPDGAGEWQTRCYPIPSQPNCSVIITPTPTTAYHFTELTDARTLPLGSHITVRGSVIARPCQLDQYGHEMMISDGRAGLDIYLPYPEQFTCAITQGEQIVATGIITDHYGLRELRLASNRDLIRNFDTPRVLAPRVIHTDALDEEIESMLITVEGTVVNGKNGDTIWLDNGSGAIEIQAMAPSGASFEGITHGSILRVTGTVNHYNKYTLPNGGYHLQPRMPADVVVIERAEKQPRTSNGRGRDLSAVSIATAHTTRTDNYVLVGGVITVPPNVFGARDFWMQDTSGGVHVYLAESASALPPLQLWNNVTVRGRVMSYLHEREVRVEEPLSVNVYGTGVPLLPTQLQTGAVSLDYEGVLVEIAGSIVRGDRHELYVDDGTGAGHAYIDTSTGIKLPYWHVGDKLRVVGIVRRFRDTAELLPRFESDIVFENADTFISTGTRVSTNTSTPTLVIRTTTARVVSDTRISKSQLGLRFHAFNMGLATFIGIGLLTLGGIVLWVAWRYRQPRQNLSQQKMGDH